MKKFYKFITRALAILAIFTITSFSQVFGQLDVFILYNTEVIDPVEGCQGSTIILESDVIGGSGDYIYTWTCDPFVATFVPSDDAAFFASTTASGTYNVTLDVEDNLSGWTGSTSVTVIINPKPLSAIIANGPTTFCQGESVELEETTDQVGVSYQWLKGGVPIGGAINDTYIATTTGSYRARVSYASTGCFQNSNAIAVTVNALPAATASNDGPYCDGQTINLTSSPDLMVSYDWTTDAVTPFTSTDQNPTIASATSDNSGTYTVTVEDVNGCMNTAQTVVLVYEPLDPGQIGTDHSICYEGDPNEITSIIDPSGGGEAWDYYEWQSRTSGGWSLIAGANGLTYDPPAGLTETTRFRRRGASTACGVTDWSNQVVVTVYAEVLGGTIGSDQNICYNVIPNPFTSVALPTGGTNTWTYAWEMKVGAGAWTTIDGATSSTYSHPTALTVTTLFRRKATDALCGFDYSNEITVSVYDDINGGVIAAAQTICYGGNPDAFTNETSPSGGNGAWSYSWESKVGAGAWAPIGGASAITYDVLAGLNVTTMYRRVSTNSCGSGYSNEITVTVYGELNGGVIGTNHAICYSGDPNNLTSSSTASGGNGVFTYQWQSSTNGVDWSDIGGATNTTYNPPAGLTQTTLYRRQATTGCGIVNSNTITVTVYAEVLGGTIGADQDICYNDIPAGFTNTLSPSGGTGAWTYEWQYQPDGSAIWTSIAGTNSLTYSHPTALTVTTKFRRMASNSCGTAYSNEITVTVWDDVNGGVIGTSHSICYAGNPDPFTDETSPFGGTGAWTYSWEWSTNGVDWFNIGGATLLTYDVPGGLTTTTSYRRTATNDCGTGYSNTITVTVYADLAGGVIGTNHAICYNGDPNNLTSTSAASGGDGNFTYLWQLSTNGGVDWSDIGGATATSYNPPAGLTQTTQYRRRATTGCGVVYSNTVIVTVYAEVLGGTIGTDQNICYNVVPAAFTNTLSPSGGTGTWVYVWQYQPDGSAVWTSIPSTNSLTYTPSSGLIITTKFRRQATNDCGTAYSNEVTVNVWDAIDGGTISIADNEVCYNESPGTIQNASDPTGGNGVTTYAWEQKVGAGAWTTIPGETNNTYAVPALTATTSFRRLATNDCGSDYSNELTITVNPLPTAFNVTGSGSYCEGEAGLEVGLSGSQSGVTYTLYLDGAPTATTVLGTGSAVNFGFQTEGTYTVFAENNTTGCENTMTGSAVVNEVPAIIDNSILDDQLICSGSVPAELTGSLPTGGTGAYTYQWYSSINGVTFNSIGGAVGQNYSPAALTQTTYYQRVVISGVCSSTSNTITVTVNPPISSNTIGSVQTICYDTSPNILTGSVPAGGNGAYTYQWQISTAGAGGPFADIGGATGQNYQPGNLTQDTWFRRVVSSPPCADNTSSNIKITVSPEFSITGFDTVDPECNGYSNGEAEVNHTGGIAPYNYSWSPSGQTTKRATGLLADVEYTVTVTDNNSCPASGVNTVTLTQPDAISIDPANIIVSNVDMCYGDTNGSIQVTADGGTPDYSYSLYDGATFIETQTPVDPAPADFTGLGASTTYRISVTDSNGCPATEVSNIELTQPDELVIDDIQLTQITCNGYNDGTITILASGGTPPYQYSIDGEFPFGTFQASNVFTVGEGGYDIYVMDSKGCQVGWFEQIQFINPPAISFSYSVDQITSCFGALEGRITISNVSGGSGTGYLYSIYDPPVWVADPLFENLPGGAANPYLISVMDSEGCIEVANGGLPIIINQPSQITFSVVNIINVTGCWYNTNGSFRVQNVVGGTGVKQVSIDGGATWYSTPKNFTNLGVNTYTVTVRDANGCEQSQIVNITGPPPIVISNIDVIDVECFGDTNGEINITASGGTGNLYYSLYLGGLLAAGPQTNDGLFTGLTNGDYTIEVEDDNACLLTDNVTIDSPDELILITNIEDISCSDSGDEGIIQARGTGGNTPYTISLYKGGVWQDEYTNNMGVLVEFRDLAAGTDYEVTIDDAKGCGPVASGALTVIVPDPLVVNVPVIENLTCNGVSTGKVSITGTGGTPPYTFILYDNSDNPVQTLTDNVGVEFTNLPAGTGYYIALNDDNNCGPKLTAPFDITEPDAITIDPLSVSITHITCFGYDDGEVTIAATGGTGNLYYTLLQGGLPVVGYATQTNNGTFSPLEPGTYVISITDDENCGPIISTELVVTEPNPINLTANANNIVCFGEKGSITAEANEGTAPYDFVLSQDGVDIANFDDIAADTEVEFLNLDAGDPAYVYVVTVTDANGCIISSANLNITEPDEIVIDSQTFTSISCNGTGNGSVTVAASGGTGTLTYTLIEAVLGAVDSNITGIFSDLDPGIYTVTIVDANLCTGPTAGPFNLTEPLAIDFDVDVTGLTCFGDLVTVTVNNVTGGSGVGYQYSFNGGAFTGSNVYTFTPTEGGVNVNVTIIVKDDVDCETTKVEAIAIPSELELEVIITQHPLCAGTATGAIQATSTGGTAPILYEVNGNGLWNSDGTFSGLSAGLNTVVVMDNNGCTNSQTVNLIDPPAITIDPADITTVDPTCDDPGSITILATGGTGTLTYTLQPGGASNTTGNFLNLGGGDYEIFVTDANSCGPISSGTITLVSPSTISIDDVIITAATGCYGAANNGSIEIVASGGNGPLEYSIDDGVTLSSNNIFNDLEPGDYNIVVSDGICPERRLVNVGGPSEITYTIANTQAESVVAAGDGIIEIDANGGTGALTFTLWEQTLGEITSNATGLFENLSNGVYYIVISDEEDCEVQTENIFLAGIQIIFTPTHISCFGANDGQIEITIDGGTAPYIINWSNSAGPLPTFDGLLIITGLEPDTYTVYVEDSDGLNVSFSQEITEPAALNLLTSTVTPPTCTGDADGSILVVAQGGTTPYTYTLTDSDDQEVVATSEGLYENLVADTYTLNVEDANGCIYTSEIALPDAESISYSFVRVHPTGFGLTDGSITVTALPVTYTFTYTLYTSADVEVQSNATGIFTGLGAGTYYVVIENEFGCTVQTENIILTAITLELVPHHVSCFGGSDGWINVIISGGLPPFDIVLTSIDTGDEYETGDGINENTAVLVAGEYSVTVTDNAENSVTSTVIITEPDKLIASIVGFTNPMCNGVASGTVEFSIEGGTPDFTISWDGGSTTELIAEGFGEGTYTFTITDANGCVYPSDESDEALEVTIVYPEGMALSNLTYFNIPCYGDSTGYISMLVTGGTDPINYTINGPDSFTESNNNGVFSQLPAGVYSLFITDGNGCDYTFEEGNRIVISQPDSLEITTLINEIEPLDCHYDVAGIINMQVSGGTPDYTYLWSNGQQTLDLYNPTPGTYTIRVRDSQGCEAFKDVIIPGPEPLTLDFVIDTANCFLAPAGDIGAISISNITGGNGTFSVDFNVEWYSETLGHLSHLDGVWNPIDLTYGYYTAVIFDEKDCKDTVDFYIPYYTEKNFNLSIIATDTICYGSEITMEVEATKYETNDEFDLSNSMVSWFNLNESENEPVNDLVDYTTSLIEKTLFRVDVISQDGCMAQVVDSVDVHDRMLPYIPRLPNIHPFMFTNYEDTTIIAVLADTQYGFTVVEGGQGNAVTYSWLPNNLFFPSIYTWNEVWVDGTATPYMEFISGEYESLQTGEFIAPNGKREKYVPVNLLVTSTVGCVEELNLKAIVLNRIKIPNAFSPNDDGVNDTWRIPYAELFADLEVKVYNRWGALIWSGKGSGLQEGWDGKNSHGREYPIGTYYYVINFNVEGTTKWKPITGSITIVR